ncbi:hypothetical protein Tco_0058615 [Tanacetum coccineum]
MESDELIKSSDENLVPIPSESEDFSDIESECDVPDCDDSQTTNFSTFSNPLFDDSTSSDDESSHEFPGSDDSIPPGIKSDDYDLEVDDNSTSLPEFKSFHVDYPDSGDSTIDMIAPDYEDSRARGFVLRPLELQSLA